MTYYQLPSEIQEERLAALMAAAKGLTAREAADIMMRHMSGRDLRRCSKGLLARLFAEEPTQTRERILASLQAADSPGRRLVRLKAVAAALGVTVEALHPNRDNTRVTLSLAMIERLAGTQGAR